MPFKPKAANATNQAITANTAEADKVAQAPMSKAGYNPDNVGFEPEPGLNPVQNAQIDARAQGITDSAVPPKGINTYGLVPPTPLTGDIEESVARLVSARLWKAIVDNNWYAFFTQAQLQEINNIASRHDYRSMMQIFEIPDRLDETRMVGSKSEYDLRNLEKIVELSVLALCDIGMLLDNSGSMGTTDSKSGIKNLEGAELAREVNITRLEAQKNLVKLGAFVARLFDDDGIEIETMTPDPNLRNVKMRGVKTKEEIDEIFAHGVKAEYGTPTADAIRRFFDTNVLPKLRAGTMRKPYVMWLMTDGEPGPGQDVVEAIRYCRRECAKTKYGNKAFMICASIVGEDDKADEEVTKWDKDGSKPHDDGVGSGAITDCVSSYYRECQQVKLPPGQTYEVMFHNIRCFTGPIIPENDAVDEGGITGVFQKMGLY